MSKVINGNLIFSDKFDRWWFLLINTTAVYSEDVKFLCQIS